MTEAIMERIQQINISTEWIGSILGLIGAFLVASHGEYAEFGFVCFLASNIFFIHFALMGKHQGLLLMQVGFTLTSIMGIYQGFS